MKILGITAEYNPFHNGHKYHLEKSRELTGADCAVVVMSGNFTQRGEAAAMDKWTRSRLAVEEGADLVLELPFIFACNRAEIFARGAVDILCKIGASWISFGSESGDINKLKKLAAVMYEEREEIEKLRMEIQKEGDSFAKSYYLAVKATAGDEAASLMLEPNNILALEYLKRIIYRNHEGHAVDAVTIKRHGSGYFDVGKIDETDGTGFAGASAIRRMMDERNFAEALTFVPPNVGACMKEGFEERGEVARVKVWQEEVFRLARAEIVRSDSERLRKIYCVGEGLENKLKKEIVKADTFQELITALVSRRYTEAAIRRLLIYILLGVEKDKPAEAVYGRVLAAGERGRRLIRELKKKETCNMPVITNINKFQPEEDVGKSLSMDILASDMYNIITGRNMYEFSDRVIKPYIKA